VFFTVMMVLIAGKLSHDRFQDKYQSSWRFEVKALSRLAYLAIFLRRLDAMAIGEN
jgi:hypothetical protein